MKLLALGRLPANPLVSVIVTNYNYQKYVAECLMSISVQTYRHIEAIICDDGSTDGSERMLRSIVAKHGNWVLLEKSNGGHASALSAAYERVKGDVICLLDADDAWKATKVERVVAAFIRDQEAGVCIHRLTPIDARGLSVGPPLPYALDEGWVWKQALTRGGVSNMPPCSGIAIRREVADAIFPIPAELRRFADGYVSGCAKFISKVTTVQSTEGMYRLHTSNATGFVNVTEAHIIRIMNDYKELMTQESAFLEKWDGTEGHATLRLEDNTEYANYCLALHLFTGRHVDNEELRTLVGRCGGERRKAVWRLLYRLPRSISVSLLRTWWGRGWAKRTIARLGIRVGN